MRVEDSWRHLLRALEFGPPILYVGVMNALLDEAIFAIRKLPEAEQEAIACEILERIEADARWEALFADPRSEHALQRLAAEAEAEIERGEAFDLGPAGRCMP